MFQADLLRDKRILITGGGTGLGKAMGRRVLELGGHLVICGRREGVLDETRAEFDADFPGRTARHACDMGRYRDVAMRDLLVFYKLPYAGHNIPATCSPVGRFWYLKEGFLRVHVKATFPASFCKFAVKAIQQNLKNLLIGFVICVFSERVYVLSVFLQCVEGLI